VGWWAIQILSIPNYSILQLPLASLSSYSQGEIRRINSLTEFPASAIILETALPY
jgi:hypothetical protein